MNTSHLHTFFGTPGISTTDFQQIQRQFSVEMIVFSTNGTITIGYPHAQKEKEKERKLVSMPHTMSVCVCN